MPGEVTIPLYQDALRVVMDWVHEELRQLRLYRNEMNKILYYIVRRFEMRVANLTNYVRPPWYLPGGQEGSYDEYRDPGSRDRGRSTVWLIARRGDRYLPHHYLGPGF